MTNDRDRDSSGRPRSARPRDSLGRPLARTGGAPAPIDPPIRDADETLRVAQSLLDEGDPFTAHEVLETMWKSSRAADRELWRGLAQLAVGVTHTLRANAAGAASLLMRGADTLAPWARQRPHDIDVDGLRAWALSATNDPLGAGPMPPITR